MEYYTTMTHAHITLTDGPDHKEPVDRASPPDSSAFPFVDPDSDNLNTIVSPGLTAREHAAIELCVPDSGTPWLDAMITKSRRDKMLGHVLTGVLGTGYFFGKDPQTDGFIVRRVREITDAVMSGDQVEQGPEQGA